jgi:hypothetical protein
VAKERARRVERESAARDLELRMARRLIMVVERGVDVQSNFF